MNNEHTVAPTNLEKLKEEGRSEFRDKWGRFFFSEDAGMDWEKPSKPNFDGGSAPDGKCLASDDMEKDILHLIEKAHAAGKEEAVNYIEAHGRKTENAIEQGEQAPIDGSYWEIYDGDLQAARTNKSLD